MSEHALAKLALPRGSFDLQVVHWTPKEIRYSCIADGAAAHSGASLGKLNLSLVDTTAENVLTVYRDKKSGKSIALRPTASFRERYANTPREKARALGREVLELPPEQVFEEIPVK
jgi:formylmethanofuran dehydrogenase subunit E